MPGHAKILITGAGGMLGTDLAKAFEGSFPTVGLGRRPRLSLSIPYYSCDLTDAGKLEKVFEKERPVFVFHTASKTNVDACETEQEDALKNNVEATKVLVDSCNRYRAFLFFFSTDYVFDGQKKEPYREEDLPCPLSFYGQTKKMAEDYILQKAKQFVIFRVSWLFGIHNRCFPQIMIEKSEKGEALRVVNDQRGRPTYTRDVAHALFRLLRYNAEVLRRSSGEIFHLANEGATSWADYAAFILKGYFNREVSVTPISSEELDRKAPRPRFSILDTRKIKDRLGVEMPSWQEAVTDYLKNFRNQKKVHKS